jgi:hypothetical protein
MVRLVFRPYTQVLRSICTSEPLRASTRVSSGFALLRNSSPSFGSQRTRSTARPSENIGLGRRCPREGYRLSLSLRVRVFHPNTREHVALLGPCFKTGRLKPLRQHPRLAPDSSVPVGVGDMGYNAAGAATFPHHLSAARNRCWPVEPESAPSRSKAEFRQTRLTSSVSLSTISRTVLLSFQSAFHLSLTVLVRYRSLANI